MSTTPARSTGGGASRHDDIAGQPGVWQRTGDVRHTTLSNGLDVLVLENPAVPLVTVEVDVRNGAFTETDDYDGLSHLYEHMFFKANQSIPDQEAYLRRTRELGMEWNGTTSDERVNYYFTLHRDFLDEGLAFMKDAIQTPLFLPQELERERVVVLGEYDRAESDPMFHLHVAVERRMWYAHYSRKNVIGQRAVIETATPEKMRTIQRRYYVPNNSALLLAGDVDAEAVLPRVEALFGDWPRGEDPFVALPIPQHPPLTGSSTVLVEKPVQNVSILLGYHGPSVALDARGSYAADVFSFIVGQRNSRFYRRLVDSGLAVSASLGYQSLRYTGPIHVFLRAQPERALEAHEALVKEIAAFDDNDAFTDEELENAKHQLEIEHEYETERASQHVHSVGYWWAVAGLAYYGGYLDALRRVTREDIVDYVRCYLVGQPCITGILAAPEMRPQLGPFAAVAT